MLALDEIKRVWEPLLAFAAWLAAGIGAFLSFPVELSATSSMGPVVSGATQILVAAGYGVLLLAVRFRAKAARRFMLQAAVVTLAVLIASSLLYGVLREVWSCPYALGVRLMIGEYPTDKLVSYLREAGDRGICTIVLDFAGNTPQMFHVTNLIVRFMILVATYMVAWVSLAGVVVFVGAGLALMPKARRKTT